MSCWSFTAPARYSRNKITRSAQRIPSAAEYAFSSYPDEYSCIIRLCVIHYPWIVIYREDHMFSVQKIKDDRLRRMDLFKLQLMPYS